MKYHTEQNMKSLAFLSVGALTIAVSVGMTIHFKSDSSSEKYLLENGFTQPEITGLKWTCAKGSLRTFEFKAVDKTGNNVEGYVCATRLFLSDNITIEKTISNSNKTKLKM